MSTKSGQAQGEIRASDLKAIQNMLRAEFDAAAANWKTWKPVNTRAANDARRICEALGSRQRPSRYQLKLSNRANRKMMRSARRSPCFLAVRFSPINREGGRYGRAAGRGIAGACGTPVPRLDFLPQGLFRLAIFAEAARGETAAVGSM